MSTIQELISIECAIAEEWYDVYSAPSYAEREADEYVYVPIIPMEDELVHTDEHSYCDDPDCPCKDDLELYRQEVADSLCDGLLTVAEAIRTFEGKQV